MKAARCRHCRSPFPSTSARDDHEPRCGAGLEERRAALVRVVDACAAATAAAEERENAIRAARTAGCSSREVAASAGISHVRVIKICQKEEVPAP